MLFYMASSLGTAVQLGARMLLLVYVPVIYCSLLLFDILLRRLLLRWKLWEFALVCLISTGILGSISLSLRWNINMTARSLEINAEHQIFETSGYSKNMELWTYLRDNPLDGQIYSNGHHLLYWFTDIPLGGVIDEDGGLDHCIHWIRRLAISPESIYLVYFTDKRVKLLPESEHSFRSCNIQELAFNSILNRYMENIYETSEVVIYKVLPAPLAFTVQILDETTLIYYKTNCISADVEPSFYLHIVPVDVNTLPSDRVPFKFDNLDFSFYDYGTIFNGQCIATIKLPHYSISMIQTGQMAKNASPLWGTELSVR